MSSIKLGENIFFSFSVKEWNLCVHSIEIWKKEKNFDYTHNFFMTEVLNI